MKRRQTPYVTRQTWTLIGFQTVPLFLLPYIVFFRYWGRAGAFDPRHLEDRRGQTCSPFAITGTAASTGTRSGFVLAWPLFIYNFFTDKPMTWWAGHRLRAGRS